MLNSGPAGRASRKEKHEILYENLKGLYTLFFDTYLKVSASYVVILGWLITSDKAREFLRGKTTLCLVGFIAMTAIAILYVILCARMWRKSKRLTAGLKVLGYLDEQFFGNYAISGWSIAIIISGFLLIAGLAAGLFVLVCRP